MKELHGTHESAYEYDGASRRWLITEKESGTQTKQETFIWCGSRICQKRSGSTVVRSYFGNGFEESGSKYFYTRDHLGSVREVVGNDGTTVASRLSYDPWGKVTETGSGALSDFTYTGHYYDRSTGLDLTKYRAYDPNVGRWISKDPAGLLGGLNLYRYSNNNPINYVDYPLSSPPWPLGPCVSISVCSRVYLVEPDLARGVALLLEKFEEVLRTWPDKEPAEGGFAGLGFVEVVAEFVKQGRPGLLCGREQTPSWLFHFSAGFNLAFEELDARAAKAERDQIARFSHWLQREYSWNVSVPWHRLLHVYEGGGLGALEAFVCLWERFIVSPKEVARQAVP